MAEQVSRRLLLYRTNERQSLFSRSQSSSSSASTSAAAASYPFLSSIHKSIVERASNAIDKIRSYSSAATSTSSVLPLFRPRPPPLRRAAACRSRSLLVFFSPSPPSPLFMRL